MNAATLSSVSLPVAETLGRNAFSGTQIKKLELPATLTSISEQAFSGAAGLSEIEVAAENPVYLSEDGAVYYKNEGNLFTLIGYPEGKTDKNYSVKKRTVKIGAYAFAGNRYLEEVTLPEHVQIIGAAAFYEMPALKKLIINSVSAPILECYASEKEGGALYEYNNFPKAMGDSMDITIQIPSNATRGTITTSGKITWGCISRQRAKCRRRRTRSTLWTARRRCPKRSLLQTGKRSKISP